MKKKKSQFFTHAVNVIAVALIIESFLCTLLLVNKFSRSYCFERLDETTSQVGKMFLHSMDDNQKKLTVFADILGINSSNTDEYLQNLMRNFCNTQDFAAVCIHRANGTSVSMGTHPHDAKLFAAFEQEVAKLPYTSDMLAQGESAAEKYVYQAVPVNRDGQTVGILYGYISLDTFPRFLESPAYGGKCHFYILDGSTGDFLMDENHGSLGNIYDSSYERETKKGYELNGMRADIRNGRKGFYGFRSARTNEWHYTCYQPLGINNWSIQLTIDERTAFANSIEINRVLVFLCVIVVVMMIAHLLALMVQSKHVRNKDKANLHRSNYIADVQQILLNAHGNADLISQALKTIALEVKCETVLLLSFTDKTVSNVYYWPSKDFKSANDMLGRNIRSDFPVLYDRLAEGASIYYDGGGADMELSDSAIEVFSALDIRNICIVPVADHCSVLKGVLAAVNLESGDIDTSALECVTYDFFMTLTNVENIEVIRNLGTVDYMTQIKNRNSYETELATYARSKSDNLWCMFIDVNGLHEINNLQGHKAGDLMLCAVADAVKRTFGKEHSYRIGGDEFLAFAANLTESDMTKYAEEILSSLAAKGYHISVGIKGVDKDADGLFEVERLVGEAESIMRREKTAYYQINNLSERRSHETA